VLGGSAREAERRRTIGRLPVRYSAFAPAARAVAPQVALGPAGPVEAIKFHMERNGLTPV